MNKIKRSLLAKITFALISIFALLIFANSMSVAGRRTWPPFEMVYRVEGYNRGANGGYGVQRYRVVYQDQNHWSTEILEPSQSDIYIVGTKNSYSKNGNSEIVTRFDPATGKESNTTTTSDSTQILAEWAWPGFIDNLMGRLPNVKAVESSKPSELALEAKIPTGYRKISINELLECDQDKESSLQIRKVSGLTPCVKGRNQLTEIVFDNDLHLLLERVDFLDGVILEKQVVESLTFK